jgi:hypothetical protein
MKFNRLNVKDKAIIQVVLDREVEPQVVREQVSHIWIFDRSGSMGWTIGKLMEDGIRMLDSIPNNDSISIGWFSSEGGQYGFPIIGKNVTSDRAEIVMKMRSIASVIGMTCFSEVFAFTADTLIDTLTSAGMSNFKLVHFTDGYPVVSNRQKENDNLFKAIDRINGRLSSSMLVGYGDYYNKQLMAEMASKLGGSLIHSSHIDEFVNTTTKFIGTDVSANFVEELMPVSGDVTPFGIEGGNVVIYRTKGSFALVPENVSTYYILANENRIQFEKSIDLVDADEVVDGLYAAAYIMLNAGKADEAIDFLGHLGDVAFIDQTINAQTNAEFGLAQNAVLKAVSQESDRFVAGRNTNYVPDDDAFCLLDLFSLLDGYGFFHPTHPEFKYKRIGVPQVEVEGYPKFVVDDNIKCDLGDLVWNKTRLNLSIRVYMSGTIELGDDSNKYGLSKKFRTGKFRTYTIVKDGVLNVTKLPVSIGDIVTFGMLQSYGMIDSDVAFISDQVYVLDLTKIPLVSRAMATPPTAVKFTEMLDEELKLEFQLKYLKDLLNREDPEGKSKPSPYTDEQKEYLKKFGVVNGNFAPPTVRGEVTDKYDAREFDVAISGFSSVPKIADIELGIKNNKVHKPNSAGEMMEQIIKAYAVLFKNVSKDRLISAINKEIEMCKSNLNDVRDEIQSTRFAVLLAKKWFPDLKDRDGATVTTNGKVFTFRIKDIQESY